SPLRIPEPLVGGRSARSKACGQPKISVHVRVLARDRHREIESVGLQREIEIGGRKAGPLPTPRLTVTIALAQRLQEQLEVRFFVGELLIAMPSTGSASSSAHRTASGVCAASARASATVLTRRHSRAPPANAYALTVKERRTSMTTTVPRACRAPSMPVAWMM